MNLILHLFTFMYYVVYCRRNIFRYLQLNIILRKKKRNELKKKYIKICFLDYNILIQFLKQSNSKYEETKKD